MKLLLIGLLMALALPGCAAAKTKTKAKARKPTTASVEKTLLQMEKDWSQAGLDKDVKTVDRIVAEDWISTGFDGNKETKAQALAALRTGAAATQAIELGEMKVRVFGEAAVVTGTNTEKSTYQGKDSSGRYTWMDVFVKRNGRWQVVASQSTRLEK